MEAGKITHYFGRVGVGMVEVTETLKVGDTVHIKGNVTDITMPVESMQVDHKSVAEALKGQTAGVKVPGKVHPGDKVFKAMP
ncbi:MAG: translation elongation factor-like protein [Elusimicrobia bacterium]|nr:translation elongation factor-like protein [Elusimicrobiota bacterium]